MHVLLSVAAVREASVTALKFTLEWFLTYKTNKNEAKVNDIRKSSMVNTFILPFIAHPMY